MSRIIEELCEKERKKVARRLARNLTEYKQLTVEDIAKATNLSVKEVETIVAKQKRKQKKNNGVYKKIKTSLNEAIELEKGNIKLSQLLKDVPEDYTPEEIDWGEPVGKEIW